MLISPPKPFGSRRRFVRLGPPPTPPVALALVSAQYHEEQEWVRLGFDRAIDIAALDPAQVVVDDDDFTGNRLAGVAGATLVNPTTVQVPLDRIGSASESNVHLIASATSGIVAVNDGGTWAGASDVALPFP